MREEEVFAVIFQYGSLGWGKCMFALITHGMGIFSAILVYLSISYLIEVKEKWWCKILLLCGCWLIIFMVIFIGDLMNLPPTILIFLFCVWNACIGSKLKRLTIGLMFSSIILAFNGLYDNCILYFLHLIGMDTMPQFIGRFGFVLLLYLGIYHHRPDQNFELAPSLWKLLLMLCIPPLGIVFSLVLLRNPDSKGKEFIFTDMALFFIAVFAFVGILWAMLVLDRQQRLERKIVWTEYNQKYYDAMEQQQFEIRRLKHDLANHLQVMLSLPEGEKDCYIKRITESPAFEKVIAYSGDATVNAVLTVKESLMRQKDISFYAKVDIPKELPFEKPDICVLFANALDNAAEGCRVLDREKRRIELTARASKGILALEIRNPFIGKQEENKGEFPKTTKADTKNHGFGLRSMKEIIKKYGGNMELEQKDGYFYLFFYLPFQEN